MSKKEYSISQFNHFFVNLLFALLLCCCDWQKKMQSANQKICLINYQKILFFIWINNRCFFPINQQRFLWKLLVCMVFCNVYKKFSNEKLKHQLVKNYDNIIFVLIWFWTSIIHSNHRFSYIFKAIFSIEIAIIQKCVNLKLWKN